MKLFAILLSALALSSGAQTVTLSSGSQSLTVASGATVTVTSTPAPVVQLPTAALSASPGSIAQGASSQLSWTTGGATSVTINGAAVALSGSEMVDPTGTTTYTLEAANSAGASSVAATVTVTEPVAVCSGTAVTAPGPINGKGGTYCLENSIAGSVVLEGTGAFDFNGFTITYSADAALLGCANGGKIYAGSPKTCSSTMPGKWTITNSGTTGGIVQASGAMVGIPAIYFGTENAWGGYPPVPDVSNVHFTLSANAVQAMRFSYAAGGATIQNNVIDTTAVSSIQLAGETPNAARARFGGYQIWIGGGSGPPVAADTITKNTFLGAPQGGIVDQFAKSVITNNGCSMNSHYSNDYCVLSTADGQAITGNTVTGQGRGIDVEGNGWTVSNNTINVYEANLNTEYLTASGAPGCEDGGGYGIRAKFNPQDNTVGPSGVLASNVVTVSAKLCPALALELTDVLESNAINITANKFTSVAGPGGYDAALGFSGTSTNLAGTGSTFTGTYGVYIGWDGANVNIPAGQTWNASTALVDDQNGGSGAASGEDPGVAVPSPEQLTIPDNPANKQVVCGSSASGTVTINGVVTPCN